MAVARMLRVSILAHRTLTDDVVGRLQHAGMMDISSQDLDLEAEQIATEDPRLRRLEEYQADAWFVREFLGRYHKADHAFSTFIAEKIHMPRVDYLALEPDEGFMELYRECESIADAMASGEREIERLRALVADLRPWSGMRMQISQWRGTEHVALFTGTVPSFRGPAIRQQLRDAFSEVTVEELGAVGDRQAWVVMAYCEHLDAVRSFLAGTDFTEVSFPELSDYPGEEIARAESRLAELAAERERLDERVAQLAGENYATAYALYERVTSELDALMVRERFGVTERTVVVAGWVKARDREALECAIEPLGAETEVVFESPRPDDDVPVELDNPWFIRPFEVLTDLYGRPRYGEIDPTPLLAPYFWVFFGITISDFAYGLMLIVGAYLIKTKLDVAPGVKRFMDLLMAGGLAAMIVGVLFGSYFALPAESVPGFLLALKVLDPLDQLEIFLVITIVLGLVQVLFGVSVAAYDAYRKGDRATAISEQLSILFLFAMIGASIALFTVGAAALGKAALVVGLAVTMLLQGRTLEVLRHAEGVATWDRAAGALWQLLLAAWVLVLAFGGPPVVGWALLAATVAGVFLARTVRRSVVALLGGAYAVYGMTGFLGDVLSYTRLAALGLSGALVGYVFDLLAGMVWAPAMSLFAGGGLGFVWGTLVAVLAAAVFAFGHVFNVVINLLGAFVHPARLQFVEFFSKFYEAGGRNLAPFGFRTGQLVLHAGKARQEEGA